MAKNIVTIDGPSGAGKSTIARMVAERLGLRYLDTGAMYRAVTLHCMRKGARLEDPASIVSAIEDVDLHLEVLDDGPMRTLLGKEDVSETIRTQEVTRNIHYVADIKEVRDLLVVRQRRFAENGNVITEGRDQGSLVFPEAALKVYLYASPEVRARRRFEELQQRGVEVLYDEVLEDVSRRDYLDMSREHGALIKAKDAIEVDSSDLTTVQVTDAIVALAQGRLNLK
jgi:CMP/dCMP kinase